MMNIDEKCENADPALKKLIVAMCHPFNNSFLSWDFKEYFGTVDRVWWEIISLFVF